MTKQSMQAKVRTKDARKKTQTTLRRRVAVILCVFVIVSIFFALAFLVLNIKDSYHDYRDNIVNDIKADTTAVVNSFDRELALYQNIDEQFALPCLSGEITATSAYDRISTVFDQLQGVAVFKNGKITDQFLSITPNSTFSFQSNTFSRDIINIASNHDRDGIFFIARAYASTLKECKAVHLVYDDNGGAAAFVYSLNNNYMFLIGDSSENSLENKYQIYDISSQKILPERITYTAYNYETLSNAIRQDDRSGVQIQARNADSDYYIAYVRSDIADCYIIFTRNVDNFYAYLSDAFLHRSLFLICCIALFIIIAIIMKLWLFNSVITIEKAVFSVVNGKIDNKIYMKKNNIFYPIAKTINIMVNTITDMMNREYKAVFLKEQAELSMLQSQINPHFLYNTLESIRALALRIKAYDIENMTRSLSNLFRYTINSKDIGVTVREELASITNYFVIQNYRFSNRFTYIKEFDEDSSLLMSYYMPKMILQPLVENAIHHGLEPKIGGGEVSVRVIETKRKLLITVSDTGVGIPMQKLIRINAKLSAGKNPEFPYLKKEGEHAVRGGIALENVSERIRLYFGDEYGITLYSKEGLGTDAEVILPIIKSRSEFDDIIERTNKYSREE